jgi:hypothetical protein
MTVSLADQIASVKREVAMRTNVYPKLVASGRMKQGMADRELAAMKAVLETLQKIESVREAFGAGSTMGAESPF